MEIRNKLCRYIYPKFECSGNFLKFYFHITKIAKQLYRNEDIIGVIITQN